MKVAVTGATGLVGGHTVAALLDRGHDVRIMLRRRDPRALAGLDVERVRAPLDDDEAMARALAGMDAIVHCAAVYAYGTDRAEEVQRVNVDGTRTVLDAAAAAGVRRAVVTSSSVTCGSSRRPVPRDESGRIAAEYVPAYFRSKVRQEEAAFEVGAATGLEVVIACPTVVLGGPTRRLVPSNAIVLRYLLDPTRSTFRGGCNVVGAADVGRGQALLVVSGTAGERYLLGGDNVSWRSLHATVADLAGLPGPYAESGTTAAYLASAGAELVARVTGRPALSTRDEALTVGRHYWYSSAKAAALGYTAGPSRAAVAASLAWLLVGPDLPRWVRDGLVVSEEVRAARPLGPSPI